MIPKDEREKDKTICAGIVTALPWRWWTSNSMRRLSSGTKDGAVAHAFRAADGVPDIAIREGDMAHLENAANRLPKYIEALDTLDTRLAKLDRLIADATPHTPQAQAYVDGLVFACRVLRGET